MFITSSSAWVQAISIGEALFLADKVDATMKKPSTANVACLK
jgi:hypothetical protein